MSQIAQAERQAADPPLARARRSWAWLGVVPFFAFAVAFLLLPAASIAINSFLDAQGNFTIQNIIGLGQPFILNSYWSSIRLSLVTALIGGVFGFLIAYAITIGGMPRFMRSFLLTFSGIASNFAGVPLAFAFIATLGRLGMLTAILKSTVGLDLYGVGFNLYTFWGLTLTYTYFQLPLMILIIAPALDGMKREWREASENAGRDRLAILALYRAADPAALAARHGDPAVRQRLWRAGHRLCADRRNRQPGHDSDQRADQRRCAA